MDKPGVRDRQNFDLHWSVDYWQNFTLPPAIEDSGNAPIPAIVKTLSDAANTAGVFSSSKAAAYWSYHITRSGFFAIQGIAGWHTDPLCSCAKTCSSVRCSICVLLPLFGNPH